MLDSYGQRISRSELPRQNTDVQLLGRPVQHLPHDSTLIPIFGRFPISGRVLPVSSRDCRMRVTTLWRVALGPLDSRRSRSATSKNGLAPRKARRAYKTAV